MSQFEGNHGNHDNDLELRRVSGVGPASGAGRRRQTDEVAAAVGSAAHGRIGRLRGRHFHIPAGHCQS